MIIQVTNEIFIRPFIPETDRPTIRRWFRDADSLLLYSGNTPGEDSWMMSELMAHNNGWGAWMIVRQGLPLGFLQLSRFTARQLNSHGYISAEGESIASLDLFIGEKGFRGRGLSGQIIHTVLNSLAVDKNIKKVVLDTWVWHEQAIRCYTKAGFRKVRVLKDHDTYKGQPVDCLLMEKLLA